MEKGCHAPKRADLMEQLKSLMNEIAGIPKERITDEATIDEDLQMQSVAFVELQVAIEDEYQIQIDPIRIVELNKFGAIVDYVHECVISQAQ